LKPEINTKDLLRLLKNNLIFIIVITFAFTAVGYILSHYVMQKSYSATTSLVVTTKTPKSAISERNIYQEILRDKQFLSKARKSLDLSISTDQLINSVSINTDAEDVDKSSSHTYWLTVSGNDEQQCKKTVIYLSQKLKLKLLKLKEVESVKLHGRNQVSSMQTAPHYNRTTATWGVIGLLISIMIILFSWLYDDSFKRSTDIEEMLDLPVYGIIPNEESAEKVDDKRKDKQS
jgi:capsular polysaccharide biosynthesis protein